jgi:hypothetical protein
MFSYPLYELRFTSDKAETIFKLVTLMNFLFHWFFQISSVNVTVLIYRPQCYHWTVDVVNNHNIY